MINLERYNYFKLFRGEYDKYHLKWFKSLLHLSINLN